MNLSSSLIFGETTNSASPKVTGARFREVDPEGVVEETQRRETNLVFQKAGCFRWNSSCTM